MIQVVYVSSILMHQARHLTTVYGNTYNMTYTAARTEYRSDGIFMFTTGCCAYEQQLSGHVITKITQREIRRRRGQNDASINGCRTKRSTRKSTGSKQ